VRSRTGLYGETALVLGSHLHGAAADASCAKTSAGRHDGQANLTDAAARLWNSGWQVVEAA